MTDTPESSAQGSEESASSPPRSQHKRARAARLVALGGVVATLFAAQSLIGPNLPADHDVELKLETPADVIGLDLRWSASGSSEDILTTSLHFPAGKAPERTRLNVRLPDGAYDLAINIVRVSRVDQTSRHITFGGASRVTIPLQ